MLGEGRRIRMLLTPSAYLLFCCDTSLMRKI